MHCWCIILLWAVIPKLNTGIVQQQIQNTVKVIGIDTLGHELNAVNLFTLNCVHLVIPII